MKNEAPALIRKALGPENAPLMTYPDLARILSHRRRGRMCAVSPRAISRWLIEGVRPRPTALRSLREVAAMTDEQRLAALDAAKRNGKRRGFRGDVERKP